MAKKTKIKYQVLFVPHWEKVSEWGKRRLTARMDSKDEFTLKQARKLAKILRKRGDKAIKIVKLK